MSHSKFYRHLSHCSEELRHFLVLAKRLGLVEAARITSTNRFGSGEITIRYPGFREPFTIRAGTSDFHTFRQILLYSEMEFPVPKTPLRILDAGANIGLASLALLDRFPQAEIIAIEAESRNFDLLRKNLASYPKVSCIHGALWSKPGTVVISNDGADNWSFTVADASADAPNTTGSLRAYTVDALMQEHGWTSVDILKMDIEGAEKDILDTRPAWLDAIDLLVVETHDRFRPGCRRSVYRATEGFPWEHECGEKLVFCKSPLEAPHAP